MADILQDLPIKASASRVFEAISTPHGLDRWWTRTSVGEPTVGAEYRLGFGPKYDWRARVTRCVMNLEFGLEITGADSDWVGTRVGFRLDHQDGTTTLRFHHRGWPRVNQHYRISCHCWAMYLRVLRRNLEHGELVPYETRLDV